MSAQTIVVFSGLLNLILLSGIVIVWRSPTPLAGPVEVEPAVPRPLPTLPAAVVAPAPAPVPPARVETFNWEQVADPDFKRYRDQLRVIGCPESTVRLIVETEINHVYGERRRVALAALQAQFWELAAQGPDKLLRIGRETAQPIADERRKVIEEVLGSARPDPEEEAQARERALANDRARYGWLPVEKRDQMLALERQLNETSSEMWRFARENNKDRKPTAEAQASQKEIENQIKLARQQLLTPDEFSEYEIRTSGAANWAWNASGFEPTEEEWRQVAKIQKQHNDQLAKLNSTKLANEEEKRLRSAEAQRLNEELARAREAALGPGRAAEYARGTDADFRQVRAVIQKYGLEDAMAREVYELQRIAMKQSNALHADQSLPPEVRNSALMAIRQETERTLEQTMGTKAFNTYKKYDEGWFGRLQGPGR